MGGNAIAEPTALPAKRQDLLKLCLRVARQQPALWVFAGAVLLAQVPELGTASAGSPNPELLGQPFGPWPTAAELMVSLVTACLSTWLWAALTMAALAALQNRIGILRAGLALSGRQVRAALVAGGVFWVGDEGLAAIGRGLGAGAGAWALMGMALIYTSMAYLLYPLFIREQDGGPGAFGRAWALFGLRWRARVLGGVSVSGRFLLWAIPLALIAGVGSALVAAALNLGDPTTAVIGLFVPLALYFFVVDQLYDVAIYLAPGSS